MRPDTFFFFLHGNLFGSILPVYLGTLTSWSLHFFFESFNACVISCYFISPLFKIVGAYDDEEAAARAYDLAALKYWGPGTLINFPVR